MNDDLRGAVSPTRPWVTYGLLAVCVLVWVGQWLIPPLTEMGAFHPVVAAVQPWRFLTATFLHSPDLPSHLVFNLAGLYFLGRSLEPRLGASRFLALYLLSALGGSVAYFLLLPPLDLTVQPSTMAWARSMVGASGAVYGLAAAAALTPRSVSTRWAMVLLVGILVALPALSIAQLVYPGTAWQVHLGGAVIGLATAGVQRSRAAVDRPGVFWAACGVIVLVQVVAVGVTYRMNAPMLDLLVPYV